MRTSQQEQPIKCSINPDGTVSIEEKDASGVKRNKILSFDVFSQLMTSDTESFQLPLLPLGIKKYRKEGESLLIAIERPAGIIEGLQYNGDTYNVPVPRSVWLTTLREQKGNPGTYNIQKTNIYALMMPLMSEGQELYEWPFPNHNRGYGLCWGSSGAYSDLKSNCKLTNLSSLYSMYFAARFNDDLGWKVNYDSCEHSSPIDAIKNNEEFNSNWLIGSSQTFSSACDYLIGRS